MKRIFTLLFTVLFGLSSLFTRGQQKGSEKKQLQNRDWSIVASYPIPEGASGLAWDGNYLYCGIYGSNGSEVYKIDPTDGSYSLQCYGPQDDAYGLTYDGTNLWTIIQPSGSSNPALATEFTMSGSQVSQITLPDHYMSGIAYDEGNFWVSTYYDPDGYIYKIDDNGNILDEFTAPDNQPWDLCVDGDYLWMADYWGDALYKIEKSSGNLIESHPSENVDPAGIVFDGEFLWYCDAGGSGDHDKLYKVDLYGAGTPEINIPVNLHDYGVVTVGDSETWYCEVENTGTANLIITDIDIPSAAPVSTTFSTPHTLTPGESTTIPFKYQPTEVGTLNTNVTIESNDPITPEKQVILLGESVYSGPHANFIEDNHDYGDVRMGAHTRWFLQVENLGDETLTITDITFGSPNYYLDEGTGLPLDLETLEMADIGIWFHPDNAMDFPDTLNLVCNDPNSPFQVVLSGSGNKQQWPMGEALWSYTIDQSWDNSPKAIISLADITGDTVADVIVCAEDNSIRCFNGNSHGTADQMWMIEIYSGSIYQQNALQTIQDVNSDGYQDVVVGTAWGDRSVVALSGKTGEQIWKYETSDFGDGGWVYQVACKYDYNNDDVVDVLAAVGDDSNDNGPRRVFCLDGLLGDVIWSSFLGGPVFSVIGVEDFTGDGHPDVLAGSSNQDESAGKVTGIDGSNGNQEWSFETGGSSVWALVQLDDISGDGVKDVAAGDFSGNYYFCDATNGSILQQQAVFGSLLLRFEHMNDVNDDGYSDILVAHSGDDGIVINGYDASTVWFQSLPDKPWNVSRIRDISGDGINDAIIGTLYSNNYCMFMDGVDGSELESVAYGSAIDAIDAIPDVVGDGSMEVVCGGRNGDVHCFSGGPLAPVLLPEIAKESNKPQVYPNPFSQQLNILFKLDEQAEAIMNVYDIKGSLISSYEYGLTPEGENRLNWNGTDESGNEVKTGIYFIELKAGNKVFRERVIRTR
ncbi:MAG: choice-of-anchor D domain-containing protein [Bacteroidales bacterium]|nr:choice-of-anchor D domain-containing protein [Bacteroidales bacterium]